MNKSGRMKFGQSQKALRRRIQSRVVGLLSRYSHKRRVQYEPRISSHTTEAFPKENNEDNNISIPMIENEEPFPITVEPRLESNRNKNRSKSNLALLLASWAIKENISHSSLYKLLRILKGGVTIEELKTLPTDPRSLLHTPNNIKSTNMGPGEYHYFGIQKMIENLCTNLNLSENDVFHVAVNIDGVPLFRSTNEAFWPILCAIKTIDALKNTVFCVGIYRGNKKPEANLLLEDFVNESRNLVNNGIYINSHNFEFRIFMLICDTPAKSYVLYIKGHSGFFSCSKCTLEGDMENNVMCFIETEFHKRTDSTFRQRTQPEHHIGITRSSLEQIPHFDMIEDVPIDYMHCVLLGVMKRLLCNKTYGMIFGKPPYKLRASSLNKLNYELLRLKNYIPFEFSRKTRIITDCKRYKATEFRLFLIYTGLIVLKNVVSKKIYNNFMCFSVATHLLINEDFCKNENLIIYSDLLYKHFIKNSIKIYGPDFASHNVHNLLHLCDCVRRYGKLDNFSAFMFENHMPQLTKKVRKPALPLQQVIRRVAEAQIGSHAILNNVINNSKNPQFCIEHSRGPIIESYRSPQFKVMKTDTYRINTSKLCDRFVEMHNGTIVELQNFVTRACLAIHQIWELHLLKRVVIILLDSLVIKSKEKLWFYHLGGSWYHFLCFTFKIVSLATMGWCVVKFLDENSVEVVPACWYVPDSNECFWPPLHMKKMKIAYFIEHKQEPLSDWMVYKVDLLGRYSELKLAQKKAKKAETTDNLTSQSEKCGRGHRKIKHVRRYNNNYSESPTGSSEGEESHDNSVFPRMPRNAFGPISTPRVYQERARSKSLSPLRSQNSIMTHRSKETQRSTVERGQVPSQEPLDDDFKKIVLNELSLLHLKVNTMIDKMDDLIRIQSKPVSFASSDNDSGKQDLYKQIPLKNQDDLQQLEQYLVNNDNYKYMVSELTRLGGNTAPQIVRKILYRIFSNELAMEYSWDGAKGKKALKQLRVGKVILDAVRTQSVMTETETISVIRGWLVKAKDRGAKLNRKIQEAEASVNTEENASNDNEA